MAMKPRKRPPGVPQAAEWTPAKYWRHVEPATRVGRWWDDRGSVICEWTEDADGKVHGMMRHYHSNGELAAEVPHVHGEHEVRAIAFADFCAKRPAPSGRPVASQGSPSAPKYVVLSIARLLSQTRSIRRTFSVTPA